MARRSFSDQDVIDSVGGSRESAFFKTLSEDAWLGWTAALIMRDYPHSGLSAREVFALVTRLWKAGKLT